MKNGQVESAFKTLNRQMTEEKYKYKLKRKQYYEKPHMTRVRQKDRKERLMAVSKVERLKQWIGYERDRSGFS